MGGSLPIPISMQPPAAPPRPDALPGPYVTPLSAEDESNFQSWVKDNHIPWHDGPNSDYDMRGFYRAMKQGDPYAKRASNMHFPDTFKTPYHVSFSNESKYAIPEAAPKWVGNKLVDRHGQIVFDEDMKPRPAKGYGKGPVA